MTGTRILTIVIRRDTSEKHPMRLKLVFNLDLNYIQVLFLLGILYSLSILMVFNFKIQNIFT